MNLIPNVSTFGDFFSLFSLCKSWKIKRPTFCCNLVVFMANFDLSIFKMIGFRWFVLHICMQNFT